jgi:hypothetical protein
MPPEDSVASPLIPVPPMVGAKLPIRVCAPVLRSYGYSD